VDKSSRGPAAQRPVRTGPPSTRRPPQPPPARPGPPSRAPRSSRREFRATRRLAGGLALLLLPLLLLTSVAATVGYVRLTHGPISLKFLVGPIERGLAGELPGLNIKIEDALLRLTDSGGLEFRLANVRLNDAEGQPVATAPLAAVELARASVWNLRASPSRISLIEPRIIVYYTADRGYSLSFQRAGEGSSAQEAGQAPLADATQGVLPGGLVQVDFARMLAEATSRARRGTDATSHLAEVGLRNATVVLDYEGAKSVWRVPELSVDLEHRQRASVVTGKATIVSGRGPWSLTFRAEESDQSQTVKLDASLRDLVPGALARTLPHFALLDGFDLPVAADATFQLTSTGELVSGDIALALSRGRVRLPGVDTTPFQIDAGLIELKYQRQTKRIEIAPSTLRWGQSNITLAGAIANTRGVDGREIWAFEVGSTSGALAAEEFGVPPIPLDAIVVSGHLASQLQAVHVEKFLLKAGGSEVGLAGDLEVIGEGANAKFEGRISPMGLHTAKAVWPRALASGARTWVGLRMLRGQILSGTFKWLAGTHSGRPGPSSNIADQRLSVAIEVGDIAIKPVKTMSPIEAPRALLRLEGAGLEVSFPEAAIVVGPQRRIPLKVGRFTAVDVLGDRPIGEIAFRVQSPLSPVLELVDQEPLGFLKQAGLAAEGIDGKAEGTLKITLPLIDALDEKDIKVEGKMRATELKAKQLLGPFDIQGGTLSFDLNDRVVEAKGEVLAQGVLTKVVWQRVLDAPSGKQPPLRVTAVLDNADRTQLGLDINHMVQGEMPVEITVGRNTKDEQQVQIVADLTNAELVLDGVAWRKPPGRAARLQLEVAKGKAFKTELQNIVVSGADIAIEGWAGIGADNKLREFYFPRFSLNVVTQLDIQGALGKNDVWDVKIKGTTYEGREFFRSLFSLGQLTEKPAPAGPQQKPRGGGVDVTAEVDNVVGYGDVSLKGLKVRASRRGERLVALEGNGRLDSGHPFAVYLRPGAGDHRILHAETTDAGRMFKLVGFYPNMEGGNVHLEVNLDGRGAAEKTGLLRVQRFKILGDQVVTEVVSSGGKPAQGTVRQVFDFDFMRVPFAVGSGQFVLEESYVRGPLIGANIRGKVDFKSQRMSLGGTYIPLQGLNNALGGIPIVGQILSGPRGEGIFGITFAVQGAMANPQVIVNPLSLVTPGIFRELMQMTPYDPRVTPREEKRNGGSSAVRASSAPTSGMGGSAGTAPGGTEILGGWSSEPAPAPPAKSPRKQ